MGDHENITYWTEFTKEELENQNPFSKAVRLGERLAIAIGFILG